MSYSTPPKQELSKYEKQKQRYYQELLDTQSGRFMVMDLIVKCHVFTPLKTAVPNVAFIMEGQRNVGLDIYNYCHENFADKLRLAEDEYKELIKQTT